MEFLQKKCTLDDLCYGILRAWKENGELPKKNIIGAYFITCKTTYTLFSCVEGGKEEGGGGEGMEASQAASDFATPSPRLKLIYRIQLICLIRSLTDILLTYCFCWWGFVKFVLKKKFYIEYNISQDKITQKIHNNILFIRRY